MNKNALSAMALLISISAFQRTVWSQDVNVVDFLGETNGPIKVEVDNKPNKPIPVQLKNPGNQPTDVNIVNTPVPVEVTNPTTPPSDVTVINSTGQPIPVEVTNPGEPVSTVTVSNPITQPVPVELTGQPVNVELTNSQPVKVDIENSINVGSMPKVDVGTMPKINIASMPPVNVKFPSEPLPPWVKVGGYMFGGNEVQIKEVRGNWVGVGKPGPYYPTTTTWLYLPTGTCYGIQNRYYCNKKWPN